MKPAAPKAAAPASESTDIAVAEIPKNSSSDIRVAIRSFRGVTFIDVRIYARSRYDEFVATPKGVGFQPHLLPAIISALQKAERLAREKGLLADDID